MTESLYRKIPIQNIYYMIVYAWEMPLSTHVQHFSNESFDEIENLLGSLFDYHLLLLVKRGLIKEYVEIQEHRQILKGKLLLSQSINERTLTKKQLICQYDDLTDDILINQVLKATLYRFLKIPTLSENIRKRLLFLKPYLQHIQFIELNEAAFAQLKLTRSSRHYEVSLHIARLLFESKIVNEENGQSAFHSLISDTQLHTLFEKFLFKFFRKHLSSLKVHRPKIPWQLSGEEQLADLKYLPEMQTDIVIETKQHQLIIDAKFYKHTLALNQFGQQRIHSSNLYQILTYVTNSSFKYEKSGLLIYPAINQSVNLSYQINRYKISACTINLNLDWASIEHQLLEIVSPYFKSPI